MLFEIGCTASNLFFLNIGPVFLNLFLICDIPLLSDCRKDLYEPKYLHSAIEKHINLSFQTLIDLKTKQRGGY